MMQELIECGLACPILLLCMYQNCGVRLTASPIWGQCACPSGVAPQRMVCVALVLSDVFITKCVCGVVHSESF